VAEDTFYPSPYGYIGDSGSTAYDNTGTASKCYTLANIVTGSVERAYFSFDTSSIPEVATIVDVSIRAYCDFLSFSVEINLLTIAGMVWWEHDVIGASITTGDWGLANFGAYKLWGSGQPPPSLPSSADIDLPNASVNVDGDSDYEFRDASNWTDSSEGPRLGYYAKKPIGTVRMWLTVTFSIPKGLFNRWNWRLPAMPGFSNVIAAVVLPSGDLKVLARFYPRPLEA